MPAPPREVFASLTRAAIEAHGEWDSPHSFTSLYWDGERLVPRTSACIMPDIHPRDYERLMARMAAEEYAEHPSEPSYAYLLQIEAHSVHEPGSGASEAARDQFLADRLNHTFHQRPDAVEKAVAFCADIHGRLWQAEKRRDTPGGIKERFYPPRQGPSGRLIEGLLRVAAITGHLGHGLPGPLINPN